MVPILHHNNARTVDIKNLHRWKEWRFFLASITIDDWFETDWRSNYDIRGVKVRKIHNFFLSWQYFQPDSKEIILFIIVLLNFLLVLYNPFNLLLFIFLSHRSLDVYWLILLLFLNIDHEILFNDIENSICISNIGCDYQILCVSKSFWLFLLF